MDKELMDGHVLDAMRESIVEAFKKKVRELIPWYKYSPKEGCTQFDAADEDAFTKAAELCYKLDADPDIFVAAQFQNTKKLKHFRSCFLHDQYAEQRYVAYAKGHCVEETSVEWSELYQTQLSYLRNLILSGIPVERALLKDYINFKPWFRVLITKEPILEILVKYRKEAREEVAKDTEEKKKANKEKDSLKNFLAAKKFDLTRLL